MTGLFCLADDAAMRCLDAAPRLARAGVSRSRRTKASQVPVAPIAPSHSLSPTLPLTLSLSLSLPPSVATCILSQRMAQNKHISEACHHAPGCQQVAQGGCFPCRILGICRPASCPSESLPAPRARATLTFSSRVQPTSILRFWISEGLT